MRNGIRFGLAVAAALAFTPAWAGDASADAADARASAASTTVKDTKPLGSYGAQDREIDVGGVNDGLGWSGGGSDEPTTRRSEEQQSGAQATGPAPDASDPVLRETWSTR